VTGVLQFLSPQYLEKAFLQLACTGHRFDSNSLVLATGLIHDSSHQHFGRFAQSTACMSADVLLLGCCPAAAASVEGQQQYV
jgi:hypothetical protein